MRDASELHATPTLDQVFKALRGGVHPIAVRKFRYALAPPEEAQLQRLLGKLSSCTDRHVVKLLGGAPIPGRAGLHGWQCLLSEVS